MNLVQIQERLKDAPVQAIMQYANGQNPMVPPYLALAELKRRESVNQSAQAQQAMQQGQPPSVKEQIEQAAGLAALQQQMQQQGMQGLMAQARPQGIPEGVPQPRRQPESEGIAGLPAGDFNFADGGIVAFQGGGETSVLSIDELKAEYQRLLRANRRVEANEMLEKIKVRQEMARRPITTPVAPMDEAMPATPRMPEAPSPEMAPPAQRMAGPLPAPGGIAGQIALPGRGAGAMPSGAPAETEMPSTPAAPTGAAPARGIAALPGADEATQMILGQMRAKRSLEDVAAEQEKAKGLFGLAQPYGEERMKRIQQMEAERQKSLEDRGIERLMRVMGGIAGRGLRGAGPAYLQSVEAERAADAAFRKQMDELMGGVEKERRTEATTGMTEAQKRVQEDIKSAQEAAGKILDIETKYKLQELQAKANKGQLSSREEYIRQRMSDGVPYPKVIAELLEVESGEKADAADAKRRESAVNQAIEEWSSPLMQNPKKLSEAEWIRQKAELIYRTQSMIGGGAMAGIPPMPAGAVREKGAK